MWVDTVLLYTDGESCWDIKIIVVVSIAIELQAIKVLRTGVPRSSVLKLRWSGGGAGRAISCKRQVLARTAKSKLHSGPRSIIFSMENPPSR